MTPSTLFPLLGIVAGGAMLASQAPVNAALARAIGDPLLAACISFGVGFAVLCVISAARGAWPTGAGIASAPWWAWLGGFMGAFYVAVVIWGVPKLGAVSTIAALVLGQLVTALVLDATGAFGLPVNGISWQRLLSAALIFVGLVLSRAG